MQLCVITDSYPHVYHPAPIIPDVFGKKALRVEMNALRLLHNNGCSDRVVQPLAMSRWSGQWLDCAELRATRWFEVSLGQQAAPAHSPSMFPCRAAEQPRRVFAAVQPTHTYIMHAYKLGSVGSLLKDICHR